MSLTQPDGYLALPAAGQSRPVLVLHPWWGLNATIKAFCDRLASEGYVVFAPDLYHGKVTDQISEAEKLASALFKTSDQASAEVVEATQFIKEKTGVSDVAVIGFSLGAAYALDLSGRAADSIRKVVTFYGTGEGDFSQSQAEFLCHFAENDPYESKESVEWLEGELKKAGRPATFYIYPDTGHWFFESDRADAYNEAASKLAWDRTLAFLKQS